MNLHSSLGMLAALLLHMLLLMNVCSSPLKPRAPAPFSTFTNNEVLYPPSDWPSWRTLYARTLQMEDNSLLITWENYAPEPEYFPIFRSTDGGVTWSNYSSVYDTQNGWGLRYQPNLYTLEQSYGDYPAGTILIIGTSTPVSLEGGVYIDIYASSDNAMTWSFVSHVVYGEGPETTQNGDQAIWEAFLMEYDGQVICYFSDQRDPNHAQKISMTTSTDLVNWSSDVDAVAFDTYTDRPGMPTVAYAPSTNQFIMTFEYCGGAAASGCPAYYKVAISPLRFDSATASVISAEGEIPNSSPFVIRAPSPTSGSAGVIIANGASNEQLFINDENMDPSTWKLLDVGMWSAYSRSLSVINDNGVSRILIGNGGNMANPSTTHNFVPNGVIDLQAY